MNRNASKCLALFFMPFTVIIQAYEQQDLRDALYRAVLFLLSAGDGNE
ncbi:hypothetical protein QIX46_19845 [Lysinibacillus boronitolerans]|nr:hypothetical protein QIX46_19845 [Lysinibacillus boronitolerans]